MKELLDLESHLKALTAREDEVFGSVNDKEVLVRLERRRKKIL